MIKAIFFYQDKIEKIIPIPEIRSEYLIPKINTLEFPVITETEENQIKVEAKRYVFTNLIKDTAFFKLNIE